MGFQAVVDKADTKKMWTYVCGGLFTYPFTNQLKMTSGINGQCSTINYILLFEVNIMDRCSIDDYLDC